MDELLWTITFDSHGLDSRFPFSDREVSNALKLSADNLDQDSVSRSATIELVLRFLEEIPDRIHSILIDDDSIPLNSYFCFSFSDFRDGFWQHLSSQAADSVPPLLRMAHLYDDYRCHLLAGANLWFDDRFEPLLFADSGLRALLRKLPKAFTSHEQVPIQDTWLTTAERAFTSEWRFHLNRLPYYNYWRLKRCNSTWEFGVPSLSRLHKHPAAPIFAHTSVRYSDRTEHDAQLCILFAGALLLLPAMELWQTRFASSSRIRTTSTALERMLLLLFCDAFSEPYWRRGLSAIGVDMSRVSFDEASEAFVISGELTSDDLLALRLLVPPKHLHLYFILDVSELDSLAFLS